MMDDRNCLIFMTMLTKINYMWQGNRKVRPTLRTSFVLATFLVASVLFSDLLTDRTQAWAKESLKRQKVIDFEDEVVEGLNKRPLDSLSQISERDKKRRKPHLYRKRGGFSSEIAETLRNQRYVQ